MGMFLQIVGAVFVALLLVVLAVVVFLRWKLRSWADQVAGQMQQLGGMMEQMAQGNPMAAALGGLLEPLTLNLSPTRDEPDEDFSLQIQAWTKSLVNAGFIEVGDFEAQPTMLWLRALTHPTSGAAAALYIMPMAGAWYDVTARLRDGTNITTTDSQREMADLPPWAQLHRLDTGTPPAKAYEKLLRKISEAEVDPHTPENFVEAFEEEYRRGTLWRVKRGDTPEELKRISAADEGEEPDSQFLDTLLQSRRMMRAQQLNEFLKERWLKESTLSAYEYDQLEDRLVVVHELTPPDMLVEMWDEVYSEEYENEPIDLPDVSPIVENEDPREAFRMLQDKLPPGGRFEFYTAIEGEIAGDLWLRPEA